MAGLIKPPGLPNRTAPLRLLKAESNISPYVWICPCDDGLVCISKIKTHPVSQLQMAR